MSAHRNFRRGGQAQKSPPPPPTWREKQQQRPTHGQVGHIRRKRRKKNPHGEKVAKSPSYSKNNVIFYGRRMPTLVILAVKWKVDSKFSCLDIPSVH